MTPLICRVFLFKWSHWLFPLGISSTNLYGFWRLNLQSQSYPLSCLSWFLEVILRLRRYISNWPMNTDSFFLLLLMHICFLFLLVFYVLFFCREWLNESSEYYGGCGCKTSVLLFCICCQLCIMLLFVCFVYWILQRDVRLNL